jgi:MYXO-CTERM domain-containing protein
MSTSTTFKITFALSTLFVSSIASSALIVTNSSSTFAALVANQGGSISTESFETYNGFYSSPLTGGSGDSAWSANAVGGIFCGAVGTSQVLSTNNPVPLTISFASPNVFAVGGNFFSTDSSFNIVPGLITISAAGVSYVYASDGSSTSFGGFVSTSGAIDWIKVESIQSTQNLYPTVDNLVIGTVPSPAVLALGALAGAFGRRRRN